MIVAALIPARKGSKGVPNKNSRLIHGKSLVERAIEVALAAKIPYGRIYVTTDDVDAAMQAALRSVKVIDRPEDLAHDETPMLPVVLHAVRVMDPRPDILVLLQPTTPSRTWEMVQDAVTMIERQPEVDSVVTVVPVPLTHSPDMVMTIKGHNLGFWSNDPAPRRQAAERVFARDGSVYAMRVDSLLKYGSIYGRCCRPYLVDPQMSLNVDTEKDWERALTLLR